MSLDRDLFSKRNALTALVIGISVFLVADPSNAQRNPFDTTPQPGVRMPDATDRSGETQAYNPVVQTIVDANPRTPLELVKALSILMDIDRDDLAIAYLNRLDAIAMSDQQMFELYRQAGPDEIFRIGLRGSLAPLGNEFLNKIVAGAQRYANDATRIQALIQQLTDADVSRRSAALTDLKLLGDAGAAALVNVLADSSRQAEWAHIRGALRHFRRDAEGPLLAALYSTHPRLPIEAAHALGFVQTEAAIESLYRPAVALNANPQLQQMAQLSLEKLLDRVPEASEVAFHLHRSAMEYLMDQKIVSSDPLQPMHWWLWDAEQGRVIGTVLPAQSIARIRAFRRAADLAALNPDNRQFVLLYWLTRLESAKLTADIRQPLPDAIVAELSPQITSETLMDVLDLALDWRRIAAATAACELLIVNGHLGCLVGEGDTPNALVRAAQSGAPRLAHAAAQAIFQIDAKHSYAGSSQYIDALLRMSRASGRRKAVVGHVDSIQARTLTVLLSNVGYHAEVAQSPRQLFEIATSDPDIQLLVLTDSLSSPDFAELTQTLRAHQHTRRIPILLLVRNDNLVRAELVATNQPLVTARPLVNEDSLFARQVAAALEQVPYVPTSAPERLAFAISAMDQLAHFAENQPDYPFYDLASHQESIVFALKTPDLAAQSCRVLGQIGTPVAQRNLVFTASNSQLSDELRRAAADSFARAVEKRGIMLTRDEILRQYSRFNASDGQSPASQEILAAILDAIEQKQD